MLVLNKHRVLDKARQRGLRSFSDLARKLNVHRNTLQRYLNDEPVVPSTIDKIVEYLDLDVSEALLRKRERLPLVPDNVAAVLQTLHERFPNISLVLFGSRARQKSHKYADFDIGIYSTEGIDLHEYLKIVEDAERLSEDLPYSLNLTNFSQADSEFLSNITGQGIFLAGKISDRLALGDVLQE